MSSAEANADTQFWDKTADKYSNKPIDDLAGYEHTVDKTRSVLISSNSSNILELGCGTGGTARKLAHCANNYLGTDISPKMIEIASGKNHTDPVPGLEFRVATAAACAAEAEDEPSSTPRFDAVLAFNYFHLIRDLPDTLRSIHSLLKPGGLLVSKTPCIADMTLGLVFVPILPVMRFIGQAPFVALFSVDDLKKQFEAAGFEIAADIEYHATTGGKDTRPFIVARKLAA